MEFEVEKLIYLYIAICIALIGFNFVCVFYFKIRDSVIRKKSIEFNDVPDEKQLRKLLKSEKNLRALEAAMERLEVENAENYEKYRTFLKAIFFERISREEDKDTLIKSYICYLSTRHSLFTGCTDEALTDVLVRWTYDEDFYLRENALKLIYNIGEVRTVIDAFRAIDREQTHHNPKLIHDGLLEFTGDKEELWKRLWEVFDEFSEKIQGALLEYFRFAGDFFSEKMLEIMEDEKRGNELRFACLRYFGRYRYEPALNQILKFAKMSADDVWEYPAIAANVLANYPCDESFKVLKAMLSSKNWQIRTNAAKSLMKQGYGYFDFEDILDGNDRYAREALQYRLDINAISGEGGGA